MPDRAEELSRQEIERYTEKESDDTHEVLCNEQDQKYHWCWEFQRLPDNSGIQEVSLECMNEKNHDQNSDDDTPSWILYDTG